METSLFDYHLPQDRIAQTPIKPRDQAKLLVVRQKHDAFEDRHTFDLPHLLQRGDLLIFNDSKVFKARLHARKDRQTFEIFLLRPDENLWLALAQPAKKLRPDDLLTFGDGSTVTIVDKKSDGTIHLNFDRSTDAVFALTDRLGEIPTPPYVKTIPTDLSTYQTIYAKETGSVAAPTAGFHFTPELLQRLESAGMKRAFVTLHVGLGTFRPMKTERLEEHVMHEEWACVPEATWHAIQATRAQGHRVIAVGTTTVRALESAARAGTQTAFSDFTNLFITPGYHFQTIDGLLTNFHLPKSTLLVLVSAFAGREKILHAYQHAMDHGYRFYSFGDAMLIL